MGLMLLLAVLFISIWKHVRCGSLRYLWCQRQEIPGVLRVRFVPQPSEYGNAGASLM